MSRCPKGSEVRYVEKQCPVCPKTPEPEVRTVEKRETDCPPAIECRCDAPIAGRRAPRSVAPSATRVPWVAPSRGEPVAKRGRGRDRGVAAGKRPRSRWKPVSRPWRPRRLTMPHRVRRQQI